MQDRTSFYIDGEWIPPLGGERIAVLNPATEEVLAHVPAGTAADIDRAVAAARRAFPDWSATSRQARAEHLRALHSALQRRSEEIAHTIASEVGSPIRIARRIQASLPITVVASIAETVETLPFEERIGNSLVLREPLGVVGAITPWNYPLHQLVCKIAPALAAGCTVVAKPSELAPLSAYVLFDALEEAGLPPGVVNLVVGYGPVVGEAIASHPDIGMVSFTGSTAAGKRVMQCAAGSVKRVALELGGKSANVILDDADLQAAVKVGVANALLNSGQTCSAWTRMLVQESQYDDAVEMAASIAASSTVGDPFDEKTRLGPLVSAAQRERVLAYIRAGVEEGARVVAGGLERPTAVDRGYFVAPTVLADVQPEATVAQEEIFGPVLSVIRYADDDDAVQISNNSRYGLSGAVWSADTDRAIALARRLETGSIDINGAAYNPLAPFGGYKQSGIGREMGHYGLEEFLQTKALQL